MRASIRIPVGRRRASLAHDGWLWAHGVWQRWRQRVHTRAELRAMDARAMADIGIDREGALRESRKFFWQS
jgi:uncharacterized protein YjiS (DUF1127 family)